MNENMKSPGSALAHRSHPVEPREATFPSKGFWIIAALAAYGIVRLLPATEGLSTASQSLLATVAAGTILWMSEAIPIGLTSLILLALLGCDRAMRPADVFVGFASEVTFFLIGVVAIATGVQTSGLAGRAARTLLKFAGGRPGRLFWQMIAIFPVLALLLPSAITRNAILIPAYEDALETMGIRGAGGLGRALMLALGMLNPLASSALLTGGVTSIAAGTLLGGFSWIHWFVLMAPPYYALLIGGSFLVRLMAGKFDLPVNEAPTAAPKTQPFSGAEIRTLAVLAGTCVLWFTDSIHKLSPAIPALLGATVLLLPRVGVVSWKEFESRLSWNLILTVGASLSVATAMAKTGTAAWLGHHFLEHLPSLASHPLILIVALMAIAAIVHLAITNLAACISLLLPITVTIAEAANLSAIVCGLIVTLTVDAVILYPAQTASNLLAYDSGQFSAADVRRLGLGMFALNVLVGLCALSYWGLLGYPLTVAPG
jgi:solute carrier family 13 (sodium-dependent dicarboxylate transporter), member 2/3/5